MNIILLSGGSGKRLWPLSNDTRSKQFLKLLKDDQGNLESMVQRVYRQLREAQIEANIVVATAASQVDAIRCQLGDKVAIVEEPERRDTFPAIALSCAYFALEQKRPEDEVVVVLPVDPYADLEYFHTLKDMERAAEAGVADLILMGIKPSYPSAKYGYILPEIEPGSMCEEETGIYRVKRFIEKPSETVAEQLISYGAAWNGGVFAFRLGYLMETVRHALPEDMSNELSYSKIYENYHSLPKNSFDYEVVEKAASIAMLPYSGTWKDLGTWNTLSEELAESYIGMVTVGEEIRDTIIVNELSIPIIALGLSNMIVAASPDGILVSDKGKSSYLKPYADTVYERPMYEERSWGDYKVLKYQKTRSGERTMTKLLTLKAGQAISYRSHQKRDEVWIVTDGYGQLVVDNVMKTVRRGDVVYIRRGQKHALRAYEEQDLSCIEVQLGRELEENDIELHPWVWACEELYSERLA
jgi:mannose-1-phosphate guanylyltransferase